MMQFEEKTLQFHLNFCSTGGMGVMGAGAPSCVEHGWCMNFVTSHVEMHVLLCICKQCVVGCAAVYLYVRK